MQKKPEIIVFAGPNGSGKSTITKLAKIIEPYISADDIKKANLCSDLEVAIQKHLLYFLNLLNSVIFVIFTTIQLQHLGFSRNVKM